MKKHKITVIKGTGVLGKNRTVKVGKRRVHRRRRRVVIATGSRVKGIPQIGLELNKTTVISSDEALFLEQAPKTLAVVGAGAVGCEFADIFNAFGTKVTLIEALPRILPLEDAEASDALTKSYRKRGITVLAGRQGHEGDGRQGQGDARGRGAAARPRRSRSEKVLMAAGRAVNTESHGAQGGRRAAHRPRLRQGEPRDAGDHRDRASTASATSPGRRCWRTRAAGKASSWPSWSPASSPHPIKYDNVPSVTYCHPEVASIGLTEEQAKERKLDYQVGRFPFSANGRARDRRRDRRLRQDHPRQEVRRDPRRAHRRQPRLGDDPRAGGGPGERVHGRGSGSRHPRPPDPVRGDRRGGARLDGAGPPHLSVDPIGLAAACAPARAWPPVSP